MATDASPMAINLTPLWSRVKEEEVMRDMDPDLSKAKSLPITYRSDWKIVLHLPEIETWFG